MALATRIVSGIAEYVPDSKLVRVAQNKVAEETCRYLPDSAILVKPAQEVENSVDNMVGNIINFFG